MKKLLTLLIFCIAFITQTFAQDQIKIFGLILDKDTGEPIPYAHVGLPKQGLGTTTGRNGYFEFKVPEKFSNEVMSVSYMGYKTYRRNISKIQSPVDIYIEKASLELSEVIVADEAAVENIIRKAVKAIPKNYPTYPTTVLGFYRESKTDDTLKYIYMAEGVLNIYKNSYKKKKEGYVSLVQGRRINLRNPLDTVIRGGLTSGHMAGHRFDFVQNREDFINERYFPAYKYWIESITSYNDRPVYIIGFGEDPDGQEVEAERGSNSRGGGILGRLFGSNRKIKEGARMAGRVFIDKESYAFIRAEFEITKKGLKKTNDYPLYAGSWKENTYTVNYRQMGDKWFFSDATREGILSGGNRYSNEIKITDINPERSEPLPYLERISRGQAFSRMTGKYDPDFWKDYNTTPLTEDLAESVQSLENAIKAQEVFDAEYMEELQRKRDSIYLARVQEQERLRMLETGGLDSLPAEEFEIDDVRMKEILRARNQMNRARKGRDYKRVKFHLGLGTHLIPSGADDLTVTVNTEDESPETILTLTEDLKNREFEIPAYWDLDIFFKKNFFVRLGYSFDFYNSIYKERSIGFGTEINLSKQRPVYLKAIARYSWFRYGRKLGEVDNDYGKFRLDGKKFNSKLLNVYTGSETHNLKLSGEFSVELQPDREIYIRGTYLLPFATRQDIWLKERRQFFNKKKAYPVRESFIEVTQGGQPYTETLMDEPMLSFSIGLLFK